MESKTPLISVALCTYNGERWLREQLDSILAQRDVTLELVALDDASRDGTVAILREYAARDPRISVHVNEANLGHLRSFEKCMGLCRGDFIAPADQDDLWEADKLRVLLDAIGDADLAYCDSAYVNAEGQPTGQRISDDLTMHQGNDPLPYVFQNTVSGHAMLLRKSLFERCMPFPHGVFHDWWLALCAAAHAGVKFVDRPLVHFRRHGDACSALGKEKTHRPTSRSERRRARLLQGQNLRWLDERALLAQEHAQRGWRGAQISADWAGVFQRVTQGMPPRFNALLWRDRMSLPPWAKRGWWNALHFYFRAKRKFRRAYEELAIRASTAPEQSTRQE